MMDRGELKNQLDGLSVDPRSYSLDGSLANDAMILEHVYGKWIVFYSERGERNDEATFLTEADACKYIFDLLKDEPSVRTRKRHP